MKSKIKEVEKRVAINFCKEMKECLKNRDFHFKHIDVSDLNLTDEEIEEIEFDVLEVKYDNQYYMLYLECDNKRLDFSL